MNFHCSLDKIKIFKTLNIVYFIWPIHFYHLNNPTKIYWAATTYGLTVCICLLKTKYLWHSSPTRPQFICWNPKPHVMLLGGWAFQKCLDYKGGALTNKFNALITFYHLRTQQEDSLWTRKQALTRHWNFLYLHLRVHSLQNCEKLLFY